MATATIALLEPFADLREMLQVALEAQGYRVVPCAGASAAEILALHPDAVVLAAPPRRPAATSALVAALRAGRGRRADRGDVVPLVIASSYHGDVDADLLRAPRVALLLKPFPVPMLLATLALLGVRPGRAARAMPRVHRAQAGARVATRGAAARPARAAAGARAARR